MPEGITLKRIIDMDEATELSSSDYALVDSATGGPKKFALGNELSSLKEDLSSKANIDGYYEDMTVGDAEQLVSSAFVEDKVPYLFRTTGGSADVGNREYVDGIVGGTVVWNQLVKNKPTASQNGVTFTNNGNGTYTVNGTASSDAYFVLTDNLVKQHTYLISVNGAINTAIMHIGYENTLTRSAKIITANGTNSIGFRVNTGDTADSEVVTPQVFDLTQKFGSTIADYIYSLEQATAGAGVAWFEKLFPNMDAEYSYHEDSFDEESPLITKKLRDYQPGILLSIDGLVSHNTVGFNQFDESLDGEISGNYRYIRIPIGETNQLYMGLKEKDSSVSLTGVYFGFFKDPANAALGNNWVITNGYVSSNHSNISTSGATGELCSYVVIYPSDKATLDKIKSKYDICINLSWSGWRNGEYEAYQKHSYPLDDSLTLRGIPKLDAQNNLYYDGDEYLPDGTVNRRYGVVDLGTPTWSQTTAGYFYTTTLNNLIKKGSVAGGYNHIKCALYIAKNIASLNSLPDKSMSIDSGGNIQIHDDAYSTNIAFQTAMSGVMLVYELATPTTETAEPYQHVQICDDFGTEEYVSTSIVPVGHNTRYPANLRDKLQHLPDLADNDGYYMIGQSGKQMHLELFRIPKAPTEDGTYTLKATVSGGTPTYTWEAQT